MPRTMTSEVAKTMSLKAIAARYGSAEGKPEWFCGRCGHNSSAHITRCRKCPCPNWVHRQCETCGEWRAIFHCQTCWLRLNNRALIPTWVVGTFCRIPDPSMPLVDYQWAITRKKERQWLLEGKQSLREVRMLLKALAVRSTLPVA